ncbi:MAG: glycine dehydrogenase (aminomethyl-transferring) [Bacteroidetes bacterium]|nr:MAG: glycine dehydrogenase (aminomethyl-transferring) [Bacteroidota bacterium]
MFKHPDSFLQRHLGPAPSDVKEMLATIGVSSLDELIDHTIPQQIQHHSPLKGWEAMTEHEFLKELKKIAAKNKEFTSYIGLGYYDCITPSPILRNIFENPGWYTQYTPYQAEISQGRLEALLNFQTMVSDLTALPVANASLLDEATAAAEAMAMCLNQKRKKDRKSEASTLLVADTCLPQTLEVIRSRAKGMGVEVKVAAVEDFVIDESVFAALVQYPDVEGRIREYRALADRLHQQAAYLIVAADLMSLCLLQAPGEFGADVAVGSTQRFGVPLGYGGPHAAYFATTEDFLRLLPGRIIGVSVDAEGKPAMRMTLQTREQHIRRDKATSNICTAQALLAIMAGMYAVYHGPRRLKAIAHRIHQMSCLLEQGLIQLGLQPVHAHFFDTLRLPVSGPDQLAAIREAALRAGINFYYPDAQHVQLSLDECTGPEAVREILGVFEQALGKSLSQWEPEGMQLSDRLPGALVRTSDYLTHPVFNTYHSETALMRYMKRLENKDLALNTAMIPLGSCTMKLNAATELMPVSWPEFNHIHPFVPLDQVEGYQQIIRELGEMLCEITGFDGISFQPNSGAQGEYTGLMVIQAYHESRGEGHRNVAIVPASAHGTNPASAVMAGMKVVVVKTDEQGNIDLEDLRTKVEAHSEQLAALMITYPSTHGVFEEAVKEICELIHAHGGLVYMDGANMNAQVGLTNPAFIGADVCHLNLHKTFSIPHGGGGPGMGPICVAAHLLPFLPGHPLVPVGGEQGISAVAATPYGSASILLISYAYLKLLGSQGATEATRYAILNANYLKARLQQHYSILYEGKKGCVAHEFIIDLREFKHKLGLEVDDITKRLIDYGFHAPTVSWPVPGTIMIEPTESEPKEELDRFCEAMISIREEIREVELGLAHAEDNVLKHSPHTLSMLTADEWPHSYSRQKAAYPLPSLKGSKFWPAVARVNNTYGDRNVVCTCPPVEAYEQAMG